MPEEIPKRQSLPQPEGAKPAEEIRTLTLSNPEGRSSTVDVLSADQIGEGGAGKIYRARVRLAEDPRAREMTMILKDYSKDFFSRARRRAPHEQRMMQQLAATGQENWAQLRKAGVRTWTTYRFDRDAGVVLMTDGEATANSVVFSDNPSDSKKELAAWGTFTLTDVEKTVADSIDDALRAGKAKVKLVPDAFLTKLVRSESGEVRMSYFPGDMEYIEYQKYGGDESDRNLRLLQEYLPEAIDRIPNLDPTEKERCKEIARAQIQSAIDQEGARREAQWREWNRPQKD